MVCLQAHVSARQVRLDFAHVLNVLYAQSRRQVTHSQKVVDHVETGMRLPGLGQELACSRRSTPSEHHSRQRQPEKICTGVLCAQAVSHTSTRSSLALALPGLGMSRVHYSVLAKRPA
jgi:hypothetical protein